MRFLLGPSIGHVETDAVRLFAWTAPASDAGGVALLVHARPAGPGKATEAELVTHATSGGAGHVRLPLGGGPGALHEIEIRGPASLLARLTVRTAPAPSADGRIAFAFGSCWDPPAVRDPGAVARDLVSLARARHVDHLLLLGDQVYADESGLVPVHHGDPIPPNLVERFRQACLESWRHEDLQAALALLPTTCTWDDHEIGNGWGSEAWHRRSPTGLALGEAGARVFDELQAWRNPTALPGAGRAHAFRRGPAAFLTLDLRTFRDAETSTLLGEGQKAAVETYLAGEAREAPVLFVACSVPPLHLPVVRSWGGLRRVSDLTDQWPSPANHGDRSWLLERLREFAEGGRRRVVLLGGDVHVATAAVLEDGRGGRTWQLTSSPLANSLPRYVRPALAVLPGQFPVVVGNERLAGRITRRWYGPNVGVVRGSVRDGRADLAFELFRPRRRTQRVVLG